MFKNTTRMICVDALANWAIGSWLRPTEWSNLGGNVVYWFVFKKRNQNVKDGINKISVNWGTKITTNTKVIIYSAIKKYSKSPKFNTLKIREIKHITTTKQLTTNTTETTWLDWYPDAIKTKKTRSPTTVCVFFLCVGGYWRTHET